MKMDSVTRKAWRGSVWKWIKIAFFRGVNNGTANCPLCSQYFEYNCFGCPVMKQTGNTQCSESPYDQWRSLNEDWQEEWKVYTSRQQWAAIKELLFLLSLPFRSVRK
jgi:hypothetical protein